MAYSFALSDRTARAGVRRIATEELEAALALLPPKGGTFPEGQEGERIHEMRKHVKKLRGLLRLIRPEFDGYARENLLLRDAAHRLAALRDADVLRQTHRQLGHAGTEADPLYDLLAGDHADHSNGAGTALAEFRTDLSGALARVPGWQLQDKAFTLLEKGLATSWNRARKDFRAARASTPETRDHLFHEWRKSMKTHWYHARLLQPVWPLMMDSHIAATSQICDALGWHHDLAVYCDRLLRAELSGADRERLEKTARKAQSKAEAEALSLGHKLLCEKGKRLTARWGIWWHCWRT